MKRSPHQSVLYHEIINALQPKSPGFYIDGTVGAGGHARGILEACAPDGRLLGLDLDPQALQLARETLAPYEGRFQLVQASYLAMQEIIEKTGEALADGVVLDLGISSMQVDTPERGFSFLHDAPLDMRFNPAQKHSAHDLVNNLPESELADIIYRFGEERMSRRIAQAIVRARPVTSTLQLAGIIARVVGPSSGKMHPATRTFQALRIAVNNELDAVQSVLPTALQVLAPGGRLAVISFHSLEDRIVKDFFRQESKDCLCPPRQPICTCQHKATLREITRKPIQAGEDEVKNNPRARSARLRVAEKSG